MGLTCLYRWIVELRIVLIHFSYFRGRDASNTGSGPEFFGFSHPTIQYLIQNLPGARKCSKYQWVKFELPKPQSKQGRAVLARHNVIIGFFNCH